MSEAPILPDGSSFGVLSLPLPSVDTSKISMPPCPPGVTATGHRGTWPNACWKMDIRARLAGRPQGAKFDILGRYQERGREQERIREALYGPPVNLGVDRRGTPPTRAERHDPRWNIGPHWTGLPQRIIGVVGLPRPGKPRLVPHGLDHKGPREYYWPTDTAEGLRWAMSSRHQGWRMDPDLNQQETCMGPGPLPRNPHIGFWYDEVLQRLGEVYDPSERTWMY